MLTENFSITQNKDDFAAQNFILNKMLDGGLSLFLLKKFDLVNFGGKLELPRKHFMELKNSY